MTWLEHNPRSLPQLRLFRIRSETVLLDTDLAGLYAIPTKRLLEQVRRNAARFPPEYAFQLNAEELAALRSQLATSSSTSAAGGRGHGGRRYPPWVFTEHGALMAATILNSPAAVAMSHYVIRAFVRLRRELQTNATLEARLAQIEKTLLTHDAALRDLYAKLRPLLLPPPDPPREEIGFHAR